MFGFVIGILLILVAIVAPIVLHKMEFKSGGLVSAACVVLAIILMVSSCVSTVPTGHTGILTTFGAVEEEASLPNGLNFHTPWQNVTTMSNKEQTFTKEILAFSKDLQEVQVTFTVKYSLSAAFTPMIYKTVGENYCAAIIEPQVNNAVKSEFGVVEAQEMTATRNTIQLNINTNVNEYLTSYGITAQVFIDDFDFTDAYTDAIEAKQVAEQVALRDATEQQMETERTRQAAERAQIQAQNDATIRQINAEADAEAAKVKAQADFEVAQLEADAIAYKGQKEAEATEALANAITEDVVAYEYAQNWNGNLPQYMMGGNGVLPIVDIPMGEEEEE